MQPWLLVPWTRTDSSPSMSNAQYTPIQNTDTRLQPNACYMHLHQEGFPRCPQKRRHGPAIPQSLHLFNPSRLHPHNGLLRSHAPARAMPFGLEILRRADSRPKHRAPAHERALLPRPAHRRAGLGIPAGRLPRRRAAKRLQPLDARKPPMASASRGGPGALRPVCTAAMSARALPSGPRVP